MPKRTCTNADEVDVHSRWRHLIAWRPGEIAAIKRRTNRRERRQARTEIDDQLTRE